MLDIKYFYVDPGGTIRKNPLILPSDILAKDHSEGTIFRFAFDKENNSFYIQDATFRDLLKEGNKDAWHLVNESLRFLKEKHEAGFPTRVYGDPPGTSVRRMLSHYKPAWEYLKAYMAEDMADAPINVTVCEFVPHHKGEPMASIEPPGSLCEGKKLEEPCIRLNRYAHRDFPFSESKNVDYALLNEALVSFYLRNVDKINSVFAHPEVSKKKTDAIRRHEDRFGYDLMFAVPVDGEVRIFKAKRSPDGEIPDESKLRANGLSGAEHVVMFSYCPDEKRVVFHNYTPMSMAKDEGLGRVLEAIRKTAASHGGVLEKDVVLSFDPAMRQPFRTSLSRYRALWDIARARLGEVEDVAVLEVPMTVPGGAAVLRSRKDEEALCPSLREYRVRHGIEISYPTMVVDNRTANVGSKMRAMMQATTEKEMEEERPWIEADRVFADSVAKESNRIRKEMEFLLKMGMPRSNVVDFFVDRKSRTKRAKYWEILKKAWDGGTKKKAASSKPQRTAAIGPAYDTNAWWHIGLQEDLNRAQHENDDENTKNEVEPFNLRKNKPSKRKSYEGLLNTKRDKDLNFYKSVEQLLRESRI